MTRFAQYFKCMMRDNIGGTMSRSQMERYLNTWISNYVLDDDNATEHAKAERPLRQVCIDVEEHETTPGAYRAIAYLRPHFQLDELTVALRQVIDFPSLVSTGRVSWEDRDRPGEWRPG
jgi:type VI secretion system protein ImpC